MRLLHTSDWHLGRRLHGADLTDAHEAWVDHVVEVVRSERVDVVLVAGDVFDRAIPPVEALATWDRALAEVTAAGAAVVVSSGNHDSPHRLGAHAGLLAKAGVHVRCDPARVAEPVVLHDAHGPVAFYPLPFLEPTTTAGTLARASQPGADPVERVPRSQEGVVSRAAALAAAEARSAGRRRTVVLAHTWVAGVRPQDRSDSEREIGCCTAPPGGTPAAAPDGGRDDRGGGARVGTVDRVATDAFAGFGYTALGHLHGPQVLSETLRYSGSPVAFSFSERHQAKGSWLVDLDAAGAVTVQRVPAPVHRRLSQLSGMLEQLLSDPAHGGVEADHVKAVLTDAARPADAMRRLQTRFPHAVALEWAPQGRVPELPYARRLAAAADDTAVAVGFVAHVRGTEATAAERTTLQAAFRAVSAEADERVLAELALVDDEDVLADPQPASRSRGTGSDGAASGRPGAA
ncbi:exonuclease SbcCD subunit D [Jannaschia sp. R86511]|uniref:metallophosphoesterase family protein n=1 Tax=Jannaschia sp. R86511 TaxID=3093853 RepID=UPI0036D41361